MFRYVRWIGLAAAMIVALTAGTAYAAAVFFARGPSSTKLAGRGVRPRARREARFRCR